MLIHKISALEIEIHENHLITVLTGFEIVKPNRAQKKTLKIKEKHLKIVLSKTVKTILIRWGVAKKN